MVEDGNGFVGGGGAYGWCTYVLAMEVGLDRRDAWRRGRRKLKVMDFRIVLHDCCMILMMFLPEDHGQANFLNCVKTRVKNVDRIEGFEMAVSEENKCSPVEREASKAIEKRLEKKVMPMNLSLSRKPVVYSTICTL